MTTRPNEQDLTSLKGRTVPVQEILDLFRVRVRDHRTVYLISQALTDAGLTTLPDFAVCGQRSNVDVVPVASSPLRRRPPIRTTKRRKKKKKHCPRMLSRSVSCSATFRRHDAGWCPSVPLRPWPRPRSSCAPRASRRSR